MIYDVYDSYWTPDNGYKFLETSDKGIKSYNLSFHKWDVTKTVS